MSKEGFVNIDGLKLHYMDWGGVGRPLVLLTGIGATAKYYGSLAPKLTQHFRVVGFTRRGHGCSDRPGSGYELDILVDDIRGFMDALGIERAILVGHSMAGFEMANFAIRFPQRVEAIVFLDAIYPKMESEPDLAGDPLDALPQIEPTDVDFASRQAYMALNKRFSPDWARIWNDSIEMDLMEKVKVHEDGHIEETADYELFGRIWKAIEPQCPDYGKVKCPMLAIIPTGNFHPNVPLEASDELRDNANKFWNEKFLPSVREKTKVFQKMAPGSQVIELDSPHHRIFISKEDETVRAIFNFLPQ
jgi:pimeloyl-ACP methyl ester carboxylesterase